MWQREEIQVLLLQEVMSLLDNLPHRCTIRKRVRSKGTLGGGRNDPSDVVTNVVCWDQPAGDSEITAYMKQGMTITRKVYFASDPGVTEQHQILITSRDGGTTAVGSPRVLDVVSDSQPDASAGLGLLYRVMCRDITGRTD